MIKFNYTSKNLVNRDLFRMENEQWYAEHYEFMYPEKCNEERIKSPKFIQYVGERINEDMEICYRMFLDDNRW